MGENRPSDVFFALWYYRANGLPSISREDFGICAEAWRELRNREDKAETLFIQPEGLPLSEILRCTQDDGAAGGAEGPGDPSAAPRDDSRTPRDDSTAPRDDRGAEGPGDPSAAPRDDSTAPRDDRGAEGPGDPSAMPRDDREKAPRDDKEAAPSDDEAAEGPRDPSAAPRDDREKAPTLSGPWSSYKNEIMARLEKARKEDGLTLAQVVAASGGKLTDLQLLDMLNRSRMPMAKWDVLSSALAALGYPEAQDPAPPREKGGVSNG